MPSVNILEGIDGGIEGFLNELNEGENSMSKHGRNLRSLPPPLDLAPDDLSDLGFLGGPLVTKQMMIESGLCIAGGAVFGVVQSTIVENVSYDGAPVFDKLWKRGLLNIGLGVVGGRVLWNMGQAQGDEGSYFMGREAGKGILGAMGSQLGADLKNAIANGLGLDGVGEDVDIDSSDTMDLSALNANPEEELLLSDSGVYERQNFGDVAVDERRPGQVAGVETWVS